MSGRAAILDRERDYGHGTTDWMFERWDADQVKWATARMQRTLPERILRARPEPVPADFRRLKVQPYSVTEHHGNVITNAGWQALLKSSTSGQTGVLFSSTVGRMGIGDGNGSAVTTAAATDTNLVATTNKLFNLFGAPPTVSSGTTRTWTFVATFQASDANFAWFEFGIDAGTVNNGSTVTAPLLNHAGSTQGTKTSGQVWTATAVLSFT